MMLMSLPMRGAWIEIIGLSSLIWASRSLPMRGAWIEIVQSGNQACQKNVAPHAGSVD